MIGNHVWRRDQLERVRWNTFPLSTIDDPGAARELAVQVLYPMQWRSALGAALGEYLPDTAYGVRSVAELYIYDLQYVYPLYYGLATYPWRALLRDGQVIRAGWIWKDSTDQYVHEDAGPVSVRTIEDAAWTRIGEYLARSFVKYWQWSGAIQWMDADALEVWRTLGEAGVLRWQAEILDLYYAFWEWIVGERITNRVTRIKDLHNGEEMN
jgi:hypothetical protein